MTLPAPEAVPPIVLFGAPTSHPRSSVAQRLRTGDIGADKITLDDDWPLCRIADDQTPKFPLAEIVLQRRPSSSPMMFAARRRK